MTADSTLPDRFLNKVEVASDGCWNWTGGCCPRGYGNFWHEGRTVGAHRFAAASRFGDPGDAYVLHMCDNRKCVNPDHLAIGSHADNMRDMMRKGRQTLGPRNGRAVLTEDQVIKARLMKSTGVSRNEIARRFKVSKTQMGRVLSGESWSHLPVTPDGLPDGTCVR